ncbi:MAG: hypothetical protein GF341_10295 [candidate division Zixibacteria bacterium]|nr:hypothetical protein [candidate division Zixibacteria bacterium]
MARIQDAPPTTLTAMSRRAMSMILTLSQGQDLGDPGSLRERVKGTFDQFEHDGREAGLLSEDIRAARFALVAFVDETIAKSDWFGKQEWSNRPLALEYFQTNNAGDEFYDELDKIRSRPDLKTDLLELYYLCLALGFEGKYALADPRQLQDLISSIRSDLERIRGRVVDLSPHWEPPESTMQRLRREIPMWIVTAACFVVLFIVFAILRYASFSHADEMSATIINALR